ncbi:hypothetical protein [Roseibium marinum]|uniref:hypothetical protein n=1 Tax=Roseibium marinum TaxID=281252 RepID=UPI0011AF830F|nr:hypothetical protein [Roseibium marinum]
MVFESSEVAELRHKNRVFDEIWRDYEVMLDELARSDRETGTKDLEETVAALEHELAGYLPVTSKASRSKMSRNAGTKYASGSRRR